MAIREVVKIGENILRIKCREVTEFGEGLEKLLSDLKETLVSIETGAGLAAPQIGVAKRVFVVSIDGENYYEFVNPVIIKRSPTMICASEGCLSIPGVTVDVPRPQKVTVKAQDAQGNPFEMKCSGYMARAICHECDHLDGVLCVDLAVPSAQKSDNK